VSGFTRYENAARCVCGEHGLSDATCRGCDERHAVYGGWWCCTCRVTPPATETASENGGRGPFCREHSSWFCPCVAGWLYSTAARADYLAGRWHGDAPPAIGQNGFDQSAGARGEGDQLALAPEDEEILG
jgi:hypothetical protein